MQATEPFKLGVQECFQMTGALDNCIAGQNDVPDAIASGKAVPSIEPITKSVAPEKTVATEKAPEVASFVQAPETK